MSAAADKKNWVGKPLPRKEENRLLRGRGKFADDIKMREMLYLSKIRGRAHALVFAGIVCVVVISGLFQIRLLQPYAEVEDIQQVLSSLRSRVLPGDGVYIYPGAAYAVDFYVKIRDSNFIYGNNHRQTPEQYVPELLAGIDPEATRVWLVFSHVYGEEDQRILQDLNGGWNIEPVLSAPGAALYLASRRPVFIAAVKTGSANASNATSKTTHGADHTHDSFWEWNIRNSRQPAQKSPAPVRN